MKALPPIDLGPLRAPHGLAFAGGKLWFTAEGAKVIGSYDPASSKFDWVLGTGQNRTLVASKMSIAATSMRGLSQHSLDVDRPFSCGCP
jgi:streptogramin lyase